MVCLSSSPCTSTIVGGGTVVHAKFTERLAKIYVNKLIDKGNVEAKAWAERFLKKDDVLVVAEKVKELLKKRGFKIKE